MPRDYAKDNRSTKDEADYRDGSEDQCCRLCTMFRPPASCTSVRGHIRPEGLCDYYEPKRWG